MDQVEILIPISMFVMIGVISVAVILADSRNKREMAETLRRAIDSGQTLDPSVISALAKPTRPARQDKRSGIVLLTLAGGFAVVAGLAAIPGGPIDVSAGGFIVAAVIIGAIGLGQLLASIFGQEKDK